MSLSFAIQLELLVKLTSSIFFTTTLVVTSFLTGCATNALSPTPSSVVTDTDDIHEVVNQEVHRLLEANSVSSLAEHGIDQSAKPEVDILTFDLAVSSGISQTLASLETSEEFRKELISLLDLGFDQDDFADKGVLRLRIQPLSQAEEGDHIEEALLISAALQGVNEGPYFIVRHISQGEAGYYDGEGFPLAPTWISRPLDGEYRLTSEFNPERRHPVTGRVRPHNGIDFAARPGTPVLAATDGVVVHAARKGSWGRLVVLRHGNGVETRYAHLKRISNLLPGDRVAAGQVIGSVGSSGLSTGPHLHFEVYQRGIPQDPAYFSLSDDLPPESGPLDDEGLTWLAQYRTLEETSLRQLNSDLIGVGGPSED